MVRKETKFDKLSSEEKDKIKRRLWESQQHKCRICDKEIKIDEDPTDVDHITSLELGGHDDEGNWGLTHAKCNKSKGKKDLQLQRYLYKLKEHIEEFADKDFRLKEALGKFYSNRKNLNFEIENDLISINYEGRLKPEKYPLLKANNDESCVSFTAIIPFEYIFHDNKINPRSIVDVGPLIEEFYHKNPQLLPCLANLEIINDNTGKIMLFDGQHKGAAQLYINNKKLLTRVFINYDKKKIEKINFRAHTDLAQIHFPLMIIDKVGHDIFYEEYQKFVDEVDIEKKKEIDFVDHYIDPNQKTEYKQYFKNYLRYSTIMKSIEEQRNKILKYVEMVNPKSKLWPLSYDALQKGILNSFLFIQFDKELSLIESQNYRNFEIENLFRLMNIFAEEILISKYELSKVPEGIFKIEDTLKEDPDKIPLNHLKAYRICRRSALIIWINELKLAISNFLDDRAKYKDSKWREKRPLWTEINGEEWDRIRRMVRVVFQHKIWMQKPIKEEGRIINDGIITAINSTKQSDWKELLLNGRIPGAVEPQFPPLNKNYIAENSR